MEKICGQHRATIQNYKANFALDQREKLANLYKATSLVLTGPPCNVSPGRYMCIWCGHIYVQVTCSCRVFIHPSLRRDVLWYTNVRLSVRPFHMSRSNLRIPWPIYFKFHRVIGIDSLTVCILFGEISIFSYQSYGTLFIKL